MPSYKKKCQHCDWNGPSHHLGRHIAKEHKQWLVDQFKHYAGKRLHFDTTPTGGTKMEYTQYLHTQSTPRFAFCFVCNTILQFKKNGDPTDALKAHAAGNCGWQECIEACEKYCDIAINLEGRKELPAKTRKSKGGGGITAELEAQLRARITELEEEVNDFIEVNDIANKRITGLLQMVTDLRQQLATKHP